MERMKDFKKFVRIAKKADALVGCFSNRGFQETLDLLEEFAQDGEVRFEFCQKGDTSARAYWTDVEAEAGGCISVYSPL